MNVHRWRKLEGSDPATYEMIQKIQTLQKRLIMKTEEVVEKDLLIQEKEKLYVELKNILARQPGPEVAEQLSVYQHNLKEKVTFSRLCQAFWWVLCRIVSLTIFFSSLSFCFCFLQTRQMKAMASELNMHQAQVNEHRFEIERLTRELQDVKRKYYENKRKDQLNREKFRSESKMQGMTADQMAAMQVAQAQASTNRFTGGGFNLQSGGN